MTDAFGFQAGVGTFWRIGPMPVYMCAPPLTLICCPVT
jgi:hypothetical protein